MIESTDLLTALRRNPFQPFRLHVSDGVSHEIRHPELVMVVMASAVVGVTGAGRQPPEIAHYEIVDLKHISRLEFLQPAPKQGNGQQ